jgi:hypothetical protein
MGAMKRPSLTIRSKVRRDTPIAAATASTRMSWLMVILYVRGLRVASCASRQNDHLYFRMLQWDQIRAYAFWCSFLINRKALKGLKSSYDLF